MSTQTASSGGSPLEQLHQECKGLPRSERVEIIFDFEPTDYQPICSITSSKPTRDGPLRRKDVRSAQR